MWWPLLKQHTKYTNKNNMKNRKLPGFTAQFALRKSGRLYRTLSVPYEHSPQEVVPAGCFYLNGHWVCPAPLQLCPLGEIACTNQYTGKEYCCPSGEPCCTWVECQWSWGGSYTYVNQPCPTGSTKIRQGSGCSTNNEQFPCI